MDCPFSQSRPLGGSCSRCCAFYRASAKETECLIAQALEVYITNNKETNNSLPTNKKVPDWTPPASVYTSKAGYWLKNEHYFQNYYDYTNYKCSNCSLETDSCSHFCPNCGTQMILED